jgi:hypothetical protein
MSATNPATRGHWLYNRFLDTPAKGLLAVTATAYSNPHLPVPYVRQLERLPDEERRRMLLGEWTQSGGAVFKDFVLAKHVQPCNHMLLNARTEFQSLLLSNDYGGGSGGSAMHLLGVNGNRIYVLDEFYRQGPSHSQVIEWANRYRDLAYSNIVIDSANAALRLDLVNAGYTCHNCIKDIEGTVGMVNTRFHDDGICIDPRCVQLIKELGTVVRDGSSGNIVKTTGWDAIDSFRYGVAYAVENSRVKPKAFSGMVLDPERMRRLGLG